MCFGMNISTNAIGSAAMGLQTAGLVSSTIGAYAKSKSEKYGYEYQSQIARGNAQIAEWQAADAARRGEREEGAFRMKNAAFRSSQQAALAARGIDIGEGSALNVLTSTDYMGEIDALTIRDNAAKDVWGLKQQASNYRTNAELLDWRANQQSPIKDAFSTLLTGAGAVSRSWYALREKRDGLSYTGSGKSHAAFGFGEI